jgi:hypothetical protein
MHVLPLQPRAEVHLLLAQLHPHQLLSLRARPIQLLLEGVLVGLAAGAHRLAIPIKLTFIYSYAEVPTIPTTFRQGQRRPSPFAPRGRIVGR